MTNVLPLDSVWIATLALIVGFGFIIFIHELGHFLVAKAVGIKVQQFAVGMGHAIVSYRKGIGLRIGSTATEYEQQLKAGANPETVGETEYRLCWLPIGGYVKMLGQDDLNPTAANQDPRSFTSKPIWARACVISAGVVMNIILAVVFFIVAFTAGVDFPPAIVGEVELHMPAATTFAKGHEGDPAYRGLQAGDIITQIDDVPPTDFMDVAIRSALSARGASLVLKVQREGVAEPLTFNIKPRQSQRPPKLRSLGILPPRQTKVARTFEGDVLDAAGVKPDMAITHVNGQRIQNYGQVNRLIRQSHGAPVTIAFSDDKKSSVVQMQIKAEAALMRNENEPPNLLGLVPAVMVSFVYEKKPAGKAGLRIGDMVVEINNLSWPHTGELAKAVTQSNGQLLRITVLRDGKSTSLHPVEAQREGLFDPTLRIGITMEPHLSEPIVAMTLPGSPGAELGLPRGSIIRTVNGTPIEDWHDLQRVMQNVIRNAEHDATLSMSFELHGEDRPKSQSRITIDNKAAVALLSARWIDPLGDRLANQRISIVAENPMAATALGIQKTHQIMVQTYLTLARLVQGTVKVSHLRGPVGIVHEGTRIAQQGWTYLIFFLGLISANLAVINFLPIPIVDGGLMLFLIAEKLKGGPVSPRIHMAATVVGLALIASILLVTLFYDTARLIGGG